MRRARALTWRVAQAAGGFVDSEGYLCGTLGVSRALGDWLHVCARDGRPLKSPSPAGGAASRSPLSAEADIREQELTSEDEFLLLACDGLWDVISSQNAVQLARSQLQRHNDPAQVAADLAREAIEVRHAADNVTVVAVCLSAAPPPVRASVQGGLAQRGGSRLFARSMSQDLLAGLQRMIDSDEPDSPSLAEGGLRASAAAV
jgi:protein phosphatase 2C family protein 2/3